MNVCATYARQGYQDRKAKRWLNTYQRRMAEQDGLQESSSIMMAEKYREMPNDFVQVWIENRIENICCNQTYQYIISEL